MTLAMRSNPRRISLAGGVDTKPSTSGATMAGQKKRKKMKAPTAVYFASGNRGSTASAIYKLLVHLKPKTRWHCKLTILQILRNEGGILVAEAQMSSMKTLATMRSCRAFLRDSSTPLTRAGSSSRSRSSDVSMSLSMTFWSVSLRYRAPFHFPYTESILVATDVRRSSSDSFSGNN